MSAAPAPSNAWTARQWLLAIALGLAIQVGLLLVLAQAKSSPPVSGPNLPVVRLSDGPPAGATGLTDPAMFALLTRHGYSAPLWTNHSQFTHALNDWQEPPQYLKPQATRLGVEFLRLAATNDVRGLLVEDKFAPRAQTPAVGSVETPGRSWIALGADLAPRLATVPPALPTWTNTNVLAATTVQVAVNNAGQVLTAREISSAGLRAADELAVKLARELRFAPKSAGTPDRSPWADLVTGNVTFHWHTRAP